MTDAECVTPWGDRLFWNTEDESLSGHSTFIEGGGYEPLEEQVLRAVCKRVDFAIDIGAHVGYFTLMFASMGVTRVVSVEPDSANFGLLRRNVEINGYSNVDLVHGAVADGKRSRVRLFGSGTHGARHSLLAASPPNVASCKWVPAYSIDALIASRHSAMRILIKIDVEGAEWLVLQGALESLRSRDIILWMEVWPAALEREKIALTQLYMELSQLGYGLRAFDLDTGEMPEPPDNQATFAAAPDYVFYLLAER